MKTWICLLTALTLARLTLAQNAVGDGRGLDANLQQGTGGVNAPQPPPAFMGANDIVTGNVPGLMYFHDDVGYTAPHEFRDELSEDHLFRFRATSLSPNLGTNVGTAPPIGVYRTPPTAPGTLVYPAYTPDSFSVPTTPGTFTTQFPASSGSGGIIQPPRGWSSGFSQVSGSFTQPSDTLGYVQQPDGRVLEMRASPLLGVYSAPVTPTGRFPSLEEWNAQQQAAAEAQPDNRLQQPPPTSSALDYSIPSQPTTPEPGAQGQESQTQGLTPPQAQPSQQPALAPGIALAPGEDIYRDLLRKIQDLQQPPPPQGQRSQQATTPGQPGDTTGTAPINLQYDLPSIPSFVGTRKDVMGQLLSQAESDMAKGQYFDAERGYKNALRVAGPYPLAQVGLVHAQIGAGLLRSASTNLRQLLAQHPELIAARYTPPTIPAAPRLAWAIKETEKIVNENSDPHAPLLLAYLGYQTANPDLTTRGLEHAKSINPQDQLIALIEKIWRKGQPPIQPAPPSAPGGEPTKP